MLRSQESALLERPASIVVLLTVLCSALCQAADATYGGHDYFSSLLQPVPVLLSNEASLQDQLYSGIINKIESALDVNAIVNGYNNLTSSMKVIDNSYSFNDSSRWNVAVGSLGYQSASMRKHDLKLESNSPSFTCESLPSSYDPTMFCSGVVDYSFVLPQGQTKESLESYVRAESQRAIPLASTQCKSDIKRVICAKYYLPCLENVVADDITTYQWVGSIPIPYKRPCMSLCIATTYLGNADSCHGLLESLGLDFQCTANALGLPIAEFDSTDDPLTCNSLTSTQNSLVVASPVEPYVGKTCVGIADDYYVQAPFDPSFAPLLPPFVSQSIAEVGITAITGVLPRYFSSDCLEAFYKVMCATFIMKPFESHQLDLLFGVTYFPSFPSNSLCQDFNDKCSALIALTPEAKLDCDKTLAGGALSLYPSGDQTVAIIPVGSFPIVIQTPPNTLENVDLDMKTECPMRFSPVDNAIGTEVRIFADCYFDCDVTLYDQPDEVINADTIMYFISSVVLIATIMNLIITPAKKRNIYACLIISVKLVLCIIIAIHRGTTNLSTRGCATKTATYPVPPRDFNGAICLIEGVSIPIAQLIIVACVYCSILELWFRVVWSVKDIKRIQLIYRTSAFGLVVMHTLVLFLGLGEESIFYYYGKCMYLPTDGKLGFYSNSIPQMIYYISGLGLSIHVIYVCISISSRTSNKAERWFSKIYKFWKLYKVLFLIVATFFFGNFLVLFIKDTYSFDKSPGFFKAFIEHTACMFLNFISKENDNSVNQCGILPKEYLSGSYIIFFIVCQYLTDYLWFFITLNNDVKNFWYSKLLILSGKLVKQRTVESSVYQSEANNHDDDDKDDDKETEQSKVKPSIIIKSNFNDKVVPLDVESATVVDYESKHCDA